MRLGYLIMAGLLVLGAAAALTGMYVGGALAAGGETAVCNATKCIVDKAALEELARRAELADEYASLCGWRK